MKVSIITELLTNLMEFYVIEQDVEGSYRNVHGGAIKTNEFLRSQMGSYGIVLRVTETFKAMSGGMN